jgi:hypothetical protein
MLILTAALLALLLANTVVGNANRYIYRDLRYCLSATRHSPKLSDMKREQLTLLFEFGLRVDWQLVISELDSALTEPRFRDELLDYLNPLKGHLPTHFATRYRIASAFLYEMAEAIAKGEMRNVDELGAFLIRMYGYIPSRRLSTGTRSFLRKTEQYLLVIITSMDIQSGSINTSGPPIVTQPPAIPNDDSNYDLPSWEDTPTDTFLYPFIKR